MADLHTTLGKLTLRNPIVLASGTAGYGNELNEFAPLSAVGALTLKALSIEKREGNLPPRIYETDSGVMNAIGLANEGIDYFEREIIPALPLLDTLIIANIAEKSIDNFAHLCTRLNDRNAIAAYEINVSCPNVAAGGRVFGEDVETLAALIESCKAVSNKPLIVKLPPILFGIEKYVNVCEKSGADIISLINTIPALEIDTKTKHPVLGNNFGGLSGRAIRPAALRLVYLARQATRLPIIGGGGVFTAEDAYKFLLAGANAVSIGTANMAKPTAGKEIAEGLNTLLDEKGINDVSDVVGGLTLNE